ncbi:hypothetical protein FAZ69_30540 [Trinickia terrae]|uniref:Uncharacterized protein n=1 Tax=Trinickia terrae TaxID=2571161 RepID=A0A4U1HE61_9BURK|nr:hypothetical protein [Trinickia terrae]TKC79202.1 hypothetical protein FAZ69_30540 [Trinickia terrae]
MTIYDLYGFSSADIDKAKSILETALGIRFVAHSGSYHGDRYFIFGDDEGEHFVLKQNVDPFDDEPAEMDYPEHPILLYVNDTSRSVDLQKIIAKKAEGFVLLRHEEL